MTRTRAAIGIVVAAAIAAVLVSAGLEEEPPATQLLEIPGIGAGGAAVIVDSFGRRVGTLTAGTTAMTARRWLRQARPLDSGAPPWARRMYLRSLLVLRALTYPDGAVIAGARDGWAYVWPRDAGAVALAYAAAGYRGEARRVARFLRRLNLEAAARFHPDGTPVEGREAQGDARGWVTAAARAAGLPPPTAPFDWRDRADYQEKDAGDYLGNAIASGAPRVDGTIPSIYSTFSTRRRTVLARRAGDPDSGVDSAVAWAVRPFPRPNLFPSVRRSLRRLVDERGGRFGIIPSQDWPEDDPWTAPTAWTAWTFAALAHERGHRPKAFWQSRCTALALMGDLRRASTPLGLLPERIDAQTGEPRSTTPLAWSHAFAILALRELWP